VSETDMRGILDRAFPLPNEDGDWTAVLQAARSSNARRRWWHGRPSRRVSLAFAALVTSLLIAVPAMGVVNDWWFLGDPTITPAGDVAVLSEGQAAGERWYLTGFISKEQGLCLGINTEPERRQGAMACGFPVAGALSGSSADAIGYSSAHFPNEWGGATLVYGPTTSEVEHVNVELKSGGVMSVETRGSRTLDLPLRYFVAEVPAGERTVGLVARDSSNAVRDRLRIEAP
jgi:hypothetical protein